MLAIALGTLLGLALRKPSAPQARANATKSIGDRSHPYSVFLGSRGSNLTSAKLHENASES